MGCCVSAQFWRQFRVLAWKNALVKVRGWQSMLLELLIPIIIIIALGGVKNAIGQTSYDQTLPSNYRDVPPFDNLYTYNAPQCTDDNLVYSCLLPRTCTKSISAKNPLEFLSKCQLRKIAVAPASSGDAASTAAATQFVQWANAASKNAAAAGTFVTFASEQSVVSTVSANSYTINPPDIYSAAVIFNSGPPNWDYVLRMNRKFYSYGRKTGAPNTALKAEDISVVSPSVPGSILAGSELTKFNTIGAYSLMNQVNSFIATQAACNGGASCPPVIVQTVGIAKFPNQAVTASGFWGSVGFLFALLMIISLLLPLSNVIKVCATNAACFTHVLYLMSHPRPRCVTAM